MSVKPMDDIAHLIRLLRHQQKSLHETNTRLDRLHIARELRKRLIRNQRHLQQSLLENIRTIKRTDFRLTYDAFKDAEDTYLAIVDDAPPDGCAGTGRDWFSKLSDHTRSTLNAFLGQVIYNSDFLCLRLLALPQHALETLARSQTSFAVPPSAASTTSAPAVVTDLKISTAQVPAARQAFDACRHDGLSLLLELVGAAPPDTGTASSSDARDTWASVCAAMLKAKKPGSDKFVTALFDGLAFEVDFGAKRVLEGWLIETLNDGQACMRDSDKQSFQMRTTGQVEDHTVLTWNAFVDNAISGLFALLADQTTNRIIPLRAIAMGVAVNEKLYDNPERAQAASMFLATRWLFASYLMSVIVFPESHGLLCGYYFSESARHRVLRDIALRVQNIAIDFAYAWKHGPGVILDSRYVPTLHGIVSLFTSSSGPVDTSRQLSPCDNTVRVICPSDVFTLAIALYPALDAQMQHLVPDRQASAAMAPFDLVRACSEIRGALDVNFVLGNCLPSLDTWHCLTLRESDERVAYLAQRDGPSVNDDTSTCGSSSEGDGLHETTSDPDYIALRDAALALLVDQPASRESDISLHWLKPVPGEKLSGVIHRALLESTGHSDTNPFRLKSKHSLEWSRVTKDSATHRHDSSTVPLPNIILDYLERSIASHERQDDFARASQHCELLAKVKRSRMSSPEGQFALLYCWARELEHDLRLAKVANVRTTSQLNALLQQVRIQDDTLALMDRNVDDLRARMWYCSEVRTAAPFEELSRIASALHTTGHAAVSTPSGGSRSTVDIEKLDPRTKANNALADLLSVDRYALGNKLADDQVALILEWMEKLGIENLCRGEERLHRLLYEVTKCVTALLGPDSVDNAVLWASDLFQRERSIGFQHAMNFELAQTEGRRDSIFSMLSRNTTADATSSSGGPGSSVLRHKPCVDLSRLAPRRESDAQSSSRTAMTKGTLWSSIYAQTTTPTSMTSMTSRDLSPYNHRHAVSTESFGSSSAVRFLLTSLQKSLLSFLLCEQLPVAFPRASETDEAMWSGLGAGFAAVLQKRKEASRITKDDGIARTSAYRRILRRFEQQSSPHVKLQCLADLQALLIVARPVTEGTAGRTQNNRTSAQPRPNQAAEEKEMAVRGFRDLLVDETLRPAGLFRDLQTVASLIPREELDGPGPGQAFWNFAIAALSIKQEICTMMLETADAITCGQNKDASDAGSTEGMENSSVKHIDVHEMSDAARLLLITAKEGNAVAQRELATVYLTYPESIELAVVPLARAEAIIGQGAYGRDVEMADAGSPNEKLDAVTMRVAHHWMKMSSRGGDMLARRYLETQGGQA